MVSISEMVWLLYKCATLWRAAYGSLRLIDPSELFVKSKNFFAVLALGFYLFAILPKLLRAIW